MQKFLQANEKLEWRNLKSNHTCWMWKSNTRNLMKCLRKPKNNLCNENWTWEENSMWWVCIYFQCQWFNISYDLFVDWSRIITDMFYFWQYEWRRIWRVDWLDTRKSDGLLHNWNFHSYNYTIYAIYRVSDWLYVVMLLIEILFFVHFSMKVESNKALISSAHQLNININILQLII